MIRLYLGDGEKALNEMDENQYDLAIVDPPYGIGNFSCDSSGGNSPGKYKKLHKKIDWNHNTPGIEYFIKLKHVSRERIIWGANYYNCFDSCGGALIWYKNIGFENFSQCEIASLSFQKKVDYVSYKKLTGFVNKIKDIHPCSKPVYLYKWLLKNYGFNKDGTKRTIVDTHGGSMSIAIACIESEFSLDCYEIDEDYFRDAVIRINNHIQQKNLFRDIEQEIYIYSHGRKMEINKWVQRL